MFTTIYHYIIDFFATKMDITLQIIVNEPTHELSQEQETGRYRNGDIVQIYPREKIVEPPTLGTRMGFLHVLNVPPRLTSMVQTLRNEKIVRVMRSVEEIVKIVANKLPNEVVDTYKPKLTAKRIFGIDLTQLPQVNQEELSKTQETTVEWSVIRSIIAHKETKATLVDLFK